MQQQVVFVLFTWLWLSSAFIAPPSWHRMWSLPSAAPLTSSASPSPRLCAPELTAPDELHFRPASKRDQGAIRQILLGMLMNPLFIDVGNFICAEDAGKGVLVGFCQVRSIGGSDYELASLYVAESHRGRGLGSSLVRQIVKSFVSRHGPGQLQNLYLLTLASTTTFFERNGFAVVPPNDTPTVLKAERALGSLLQSFFGNSVVCMQPTSEWS